MKNYFLNGSNNAIQFISWIKNIKYLLEMIYFLVKIWNDFVIWELNVFVKCVSYKDFKWKIGFYK